MEVLFHLIFELIKIGVLATVYAALLLILCLLFLRVRENDTLRKLTKSKTKFFTVAGFLISLLLFFWMFTYWGDHGLGDSAKIPIGHGKHVSEMNGTSAYIQPEGYEHQMFSIRSFAVKEQYCAGHIAKGEYFVWDLESNLHEILSEGEYLERAQAKDLPPEEAFKDFRTAYRDHWSGWRFWLLP